MPQFFVRWDSKNVSWLYLGTAQIHDYENNVDVPSIGKTIKFKFYLTSAEQSLDSPPPEGIAVAATEGGRTSVQVNKYERDPLTDLLPVCPNCHAMLHSQAPALQPEELGSRLKRRVD